LKKSTYVQESHLIRWLTVSFCFFCNGVIFVSQARGEKAVREEFPDAIILRPSDIYGHEDKYFNYYSCKYIIILDEVFVICRITKVEVSVIS
jgi:hypothetical protein